MNLADKYKSEYLKKWWDASTDLPHMDCRYDLVTQRAKEREMDSLVNQLLKEVRKSSVDIEGESPHWGMKVKGVLKRAGDDVLELSGGGMNKLLSGGYLKVTSDFIDKAREFDKDIDIADIMQAMRNAWIMNCIQVLFGSKVEYTPSIFAYSMLYPYTDNFLDSSKISLDKKKRFGERFRLRLEGKAVQADNAFEEKVFRLVDIMEVQFGRREFPQVYESLVEIHDSQQNSIRQQKGSFSPYEIDIPGISVKKGGASVMADGYLVNGKMTEAQASFMFGFGVFLQLVDDAQDVVTDSKNGHMTVFSQIAGKWKLDSIMNKLLNFMFDLLDSDECFNLPEMKEQKSLIKSSCLLLLLVAVSNNHRLFSSAYLRNLECYCPFSLGYLRKLYARAGREYATLFLKNRKDSAIIKGLAL